MKRLGPALLSLPLITVAAMPAQAVYLNESNMTVQLGASMSAEPFANRTTAESLANMIDLPDASATEHHTQPSHVWVSGGTLETDFDLLVDYDLTTLHFWNYFTEGYDVDNIDLRFYNASNTLIASQLGIAPATSAGNPIAAEDIPLTADAKNVRYINAVFSGTNGQVDFNNIGFTGELSSIVLGDLNGDGALTNGDISAFVLALTDVPGYASTYPGLDPDARGDFTGDNQLTNGDIAGFVDALTGGPGVVPEPGSLALLSLGALALVRRRR